ADGDWSRHCWNECDELIAIFYDSEELEKHFLILPSYFLRPSFFLFLQPLQQVKINAVGILQADHSCPPRLILRLAVESNPFGGIPNESPSWRVRTSTAKRAARRSTMHVNAALCMPNCR